MDWAFQHNDDPQKPVSFESLGADSVQGLDVNGQYDNRVCVLGLTSRLFVRRAYWPRPSISAAEFASDFEVQWERRRIGGTYLAPDM